MKSKIRLRREANAVCPKCKSPDYTYKGRVYEPDGKHSFNCNSCNNNWLYGKTDSVYTELK
jgi:transposase-like protein